MKIILIIFFLIPINLFSNNIQLSCDNGYSFKIKTIQGNTSTFYKYQNESWNKIKKFNIKSNNLELFIPNMEYLSCADKSLPTCKYSILISNFNSRRPIVREVILDDCYIGTMGCNKYEKGLRLNKHLCKSTIH